MDFDGEIFGVSSEQVGSVFNDMLASPSTNIIWMVIVVVLGIVVCSFGLQNGVERITKIMMIGLLTLMVVLAFADSRWTEDWTDFVSICSRILKGEGDRRGEFASRAFQRHSGSHEPVVFTLSLGIGAMAIFGSYLGKDKRLLGEAVNVAVLDTFCGNRCRADYLSGVFCIWGQPRQRTEPDLHHAAECIS